MLTVDFNNFHIQPGSKVLDAGCGTGRHMRELFNSGSVTVIGIDKKWSDLCGARDSLSSMENNGDSAYITAMADIATLPFPDAAFDIIICSEVLEHIYDGAAAVREMLRVLKPGKDLVISVPSYLPERICWTISEEYHLEPGGHVRIYKKRELRNLLEKAGAKCWKIDYKHSLHVPYWWLKCAVGHKNEQSRLVNMYKKFLEWDILKHPAWTYWLDKFLNLVMAKSVVFYLKKGC